MTVETVIPMTGRNAEMMTVPTDSRTTGAEVAIEEERVEDAVTVTIVDLVITIKSDPKTTVSRMWQLMLSPKSRRAPRRKPPPQNPTIRNVLARMMLARHLPLRRLM